MELPLVETEMESLLNKPLLKPDGSNFKRWYERLWKYLNRRNMLFTLEEHLEERPSPSVDEEENERRQDRVDAFDGVHEILYKTMEPEMAQHFMLFDPCETLQMLRYDFLKEISMIRYEYWDEILSTMMEENTC